MPTIFIDIETVPDQTEGALVEFVEKVQPPARYSKPESIEKWLEDNRFEAGQEAWLKTALDGSRGEIIVIGWSVDIDGKRGATNSVRRKPGEKESYLIRRFFKRLAKQCAGITDQRMIKWVGHNIVGFDLRFLYQRCVILGILEGAWLPVDRRHGSPQVFDTMEAWAGWKQYIKLEELCRLLRIKSKLDGMSGADVYPLWRKGEMNKLALYCRTDVARTRAAYRRLTFQEKV